MRKSILLVLLLILFFLSQTKAQNVMWIDSVSSPPNQTVTFSVYVSNAQQFVAFQLDVLLPNVLNYIENSSALTVRADGHVLSASLVETRKLRVISYSMTGKKFLGTQGAVLTFQCQSKTQPGTYSLQIQNAIIADTSLQNILTNTLNGSFILLAPDIKTNVDSLDFGSIPLGQTSERSITITNLGTTQLNISKLSSSHPEIRFLDSSAVNINPNGSIVRTLKFAPTIKGVKSGRAEIISNDPDEMNKTIFYKAHAYAVNEIRIGSAFGRSGYETQLNVRINNMEPFSAFEFRITLPSAAKYINGSARLTNRKVDHNIFADTSSGNIVRVVVYSPTNKNFTGLDGDIVQLSLNLSGTGGDYSLPVSNAIISDSSGVNIISAFYSGSLQIASPTISFNTSSLNFGQVSILDTARSTIRISNNGSDTLKVNSIISSNTLFINETTTPFQLSPNAFRDVSLRFHSPIKGIYSGELKIYHNDVVRNPSTINLTATAFAPNRLKVISPTGGTNQIISLPFEIFNTEPFVAFQFDVTLPSSIIYQSNTVQLSSRKQDHVVIASVLPNGKIRVIAYSINQSPFLGNDGEIVRFNIKLPLSTGVYQATLSDVIIGSAEVGDISSGFENGTINVIQASVINTKLFLNGTYNNSSMLTTLNSSGLIPLNSHNAYDTAAYGYTSSSVQSIPNPNIVDWVLVELRTGTPSNTKVAARAGFIKSDGTIVDIDGTSPLTFTNVSEGNYYVVVRHRNHLSIMSSSAIALTSSSSLYDFTTGQDKAYGTSPMVDLGGGIYGMRGGDVNGSGIITFSDITEIITRNNQTGYYSADVNMSGIVTFSDITKIISNNNSSTQVP